MPASVICGPFICFLWPVRQRTSKFEYFPKGCCVGSLNVSSLEAEELSFRHPLEIVRTHTSTTSKLPTQCVPRLSPLPCFPIQVCGGCGGMGVARHLCPCNYCKKDASYVQISLLGCMQVWVARLSVESGPAVCVCCWSLLCGCIIRDTIYMLSAPRLFIIYFVL